METKPYDKSRDRVMFREDLRWCKIERVEEEDGTISGRLASMTVIQWPNIF